MEKVIAPRGGRGKADAGRNIHRVFLSRAHRAWAFLHRGPGRAGGRGLLQRRERAGRLLPARAAPTADGGGTRILSVHPFTSGLEPLLFFSDYRRRFADGIAFYQRYFHAANLLGAKLFVFHGDRRNTTRSRRFYFDRFAELCEAGRRMGVTVAQENVPRCAGYCPDFFTDMRAYLPGARFVLDIKQCVRAGYSPAEMADAMGEGLVHLHVSDHGARGDCLAARGGGARPCRAAREGARVRLRRRRDARALPRQLRRVWGAR